MGHEKGIPRIAHSFLEGTTEMAIDTFTKIGTLETKLILDILGLRHLKDIQEIAISRRYMYLRLRGKAWAVYTHL